MGTTALGLRYPEPTDRLNQGAQAIEDLALDVDAKLTAGPAGLLGYAEQQGPQAVTGAEADLTGLSVTFTVAAGRKVRLRAVVMDTHTVAAGWDHIYIREGVTLITEAQVTFSAGVAGLLVAERIITPTAGAHTYKVTFLAEAGTANIGTAGRALYSTLTAEDVGV